MDNKSSNLVSYMFIFLGLVGGLILLFPFGWVVFLFCVLTEPRNTMLRPHIKKKHAA